MFSASYFCLTRQQQMNLFVSSIAGSGGFTFKTAFMETYYHPLSQQGPRLDFKVTMKSKLNTENTLFFSQHFKITSFSWPPQFNSYNVISSHLAIEKINPTMKPNMFIRGKSM